jgi:hypothetical protein
MFEKLTIKFYNETKQTFSFLVKTISQHNTTNIFCKASDLNIEHKIII